MSGGGTRPPHGAEEARGLRGRSPWLHRFALLVVGATFVLIIAGGLVTSTGSALAVPDWPLSFGMVMPPMVGGIFYEHGHRMIAGTVGTMTLILALWLAWAEPRRWVKVLGFCALGAVVSQAILGGVTVLLLLPPAISVAHATLAQTFFCLTIAIALVTSPRWGIAPSWLAGGPGATASAGHLPGATSQHPIGERHISPFAAREAGTSRSPDPSRPASLAPGLALLTFAAVYIQLLIGAWMRHTDAGLAIPDFPLAFGHLIPPQWSPQIATHFAHRVWALVVLATGASFIVSALRLRPDPSTLGPGTAAIQPGRGEVLQAGEAEEQSGRKVPAALGYRHDRLAQIHRPALFLAALLPLQITLGALTVLSGKHVGITTAHVATGALILATSFIVSIRLWRPAIAARWEASRRKAEIPGAAETSRPAAI